MAYSRRISEQQATQIIAFLAQAEEQGTATLEPPRAADAEPLQFESPRQAITALGAKTNPQKIIALAFYLGATSDNGLVVSTDDILAAFAKAAERTPKNLNRDLRVAVADGWLYQESNTTLRLLSATDEIARQGFAKVKTARRPPAKGGPKRPRAQVRQEVLDTPVVTSLEGYLDFFDVKRYSDQVLWIIKYAELFDITGVQRQEVLHFADKMGSGINSKNLTAINAANIKNGYLAVEKDSFALTAKGEKYLWENLGKTPDNRG